MEAGAAPALAHRQRTQRQMRGGKGGMGIARLHDDRACTMTSLQSRPCPWEARTPVGATMQACLCCRRAGLLAARDGTCKRACWQELLLLPPLAPPA